MNQRTISVRVEVAVNVDDNRDLSEVRDDLAQRAKRAIERSPRWVRTYAASSVLRMQEAPRW